MPARHACREIDFSSWKRARHYEMFSAHEYPFVGLTTELNISKWDAARRRAGRKFFPAFLHSLMKAVNAIENFRYRLDGEKVLLYEKVDPSIPLSFTGHHGLVDGFHLGGLLKRLKEYD